MPKTILKYANKEDIPAGLLAFAKDDNTVEVWANTDETAVAAELNPTLEKHRNTVLAEKETLELKYKALVATSSGEDIDKAKIKAENERLKQTSVPAEDVELAKTVKTLFPNVQPTELKTQIETLKTQAQTGVVLSKKEQQTQIAKALGVKNVDYFNDVLQIPDMLKDVEGDIFLESVTENDKTFQKPFVNYKKADGTTEKKAFSEYQKLNDKWALHQPTLMQETVSPDNKKWLPQTGGEGDTGSTGLLSAHIKKANETSQQLANPFMKNAPQTAQGQSAQGAGQPGSFQGVNQN